ncbi:MAG: DUF72 domain-containing protein, partial [Candidatus Eremiobacteraeota bacterium]|nr:DUF72 domain-containing protein [Candidatus Eremiobacteraeota bacterium]
LKVPREITHEHRLLAARPLVDEFVASAAELGPKLEAVLVQLPPDFAPAERDALEPFVAELPTGPRWALEVRDPAWLHGDVHARLRDTLGRRGVALAVTDGAFVPLESMLEELRRPTASHAYVRWLGGRDALPRFDRVVFDRSAEIARWAAALKDATNDLMRVCGYANNTYSGHAPATVRALYAALGIPHARPPLVEQPSLFE